MSKFITFIHEDELNKIRGLIRTIYSLCNDMEEIASEIEETLDNAQIVKVPE